MEQAPYAGSTMRRLPALLKRSAVEPFCSAIQPRMRTAISYQPPRSCSVRVRRGRHETSSSAQGRAKCGNEKTPRHPTTHGPGLVVTALRWAFVAFFSFLDVSSLDRKSRPDARVPGVFFSLSTARTARGELPSRVNAMRP